ncbi:ABC transporter permease subunit [Celerinatantimonas sp. YJH-8]|uniref:ABC transporter permease subunit n=1 Tax=Celerinatantimonas sp. YJH-8 TaxID=3228714 RepID=UPI0038C73DAA
MGLALLISLVGIGGILWLSGWGLLQAGQGLDWSELSDPYLWHILWFSCYQAFISAILSLIAGILLGRCLFYLKPKGLQYWLAFASVCFVAPVILVVLGVIGAFGQDGFWSQLGLWHQPLYGLTGILIAHLFLNIPLFMRHSYLLWQSIAPAQWQQAEQLGLSSWQRFRYLEWPLLQSGLLSSGLLVFMLCFGSFTIVLALGGGPASATLEVAIYQALRYDFEPDFALVCALLQLLIGLLLFYLLKQRQAASDVAKAHDYEPVIQPWERYGLKGYAVVCMIFFGSVFVGMVSPLASLTLSAIEFSTLISSTLLSVQIALLSWLFCGIFLTALLMLIVFSWQQQQFRYLDSIAQLLASSLLLFPAMVVSTGLFFWLWQRGFQGHSMALIALIHALMALPFAIRLMRPALSQLQRHYQVLLAELHLSVWVRWRVIYAPILARPLALTSAFVLVLSLGDMGVVALLGDVDRVTLPMMLYQQLGHYQYARASLTGLWLLWVCVIIFAGFEYIACKGSHVRR